MNGCDRHMTEGFPGCRDCYHHLRGRYDYQKSETERLDKWADEQAKLLREAISQREAANICHDADLKEKDALVLQNSELRAALDTAKLDRDSFQSSSVRLGKDLEESNRLISEMEKDYEVAQRGLSYILHGAKDATDMYAAANAAMAKMRPSGGFADKRKGLDPCERCGGEGASHKIGCPRWNEPTSVGHD